MPSHGLRFLIMEALIFTSHFKSVQCSIRREHQLILNRPGNVYCDFVDSNKVLLVAQHRPVLSPADTLVTFQNHK